MSKKIELTYSTQDSGYVPGRAYAHPRYYSSPRENVSKVFIVGDWPKIRADYEARGVPVEQLDAAPEAAPLSTSAAPAALAGPRSDEEKSAVVIPENWRELKWVGKADVLTLRALAALVCDTPVLNKGQAVEAIEAELKRREDANA